MGTTQGRRGPVAAGFLLIAAMATLSALTASAQERNLLTGRYSEQELKELIIPPDQWHPFPRHGEREVWSGLDQQLVSSYIRKGEELLDYDWPNLPASVFMEFSRNGNRSNYQEPYFERRNNLASLVIAELAEGEGRFMSSILNGIWAICEETFWGVPAHLYLQKEGIGLPDASEPVVDLFAAETGALLAWTVYLMEDALDRLSPLICDRVRLEAGRRILTPCLERDDFWWQGLLPLKETGVNLERLNNWSPWIDSNWLTAVLMLEEDPERRIRSIYKIMLCLDKYLNPHPADGGCDEGPSYWGHAAGRVFHSLELLESASGGRINIFSEPLIREMGKYIYRAHIAGSYYINFADASAVIRVDPSLLFRYGKSINDEMMAGLGAYAARIQDYGNPTITGALGMQLYGLFNLAGLRSQEPEVPQLAGLWLPDIQVMAARSSPDTKRSFYMAAKGGHNHESHNHNDVGNFIIYLDGRPVIIDIGVETYSRKTFRPETRYEIWTMQSAYHNLPTINGFLQEAGLEYRARDVSYEQGNGSTIFSLELSGAYPGEARVASYTRSLTLNHGKSVVITDAYSLEEFIAPLSINLMTPLDAEVDPDGKIRLTDREGRLEDVVIQFDAAKFTVRPEFIRIIDKKLRSAWGSMLTRIILEAKDKKLNDEFTVEIK